MFSHNESKNTICPSFLLKAWDYIGCVPSQRLRNGLVYGMYGFTAGTLIALFMSETITLGLRLKVRNEETCHYEKIYINQSGCKYNEDRLIGNSPRVCREFINQTNIWGERSSTAQNDGPLTNCDWIHLANSFIQNASTYGENKGHEWHPGAAKKAALYSLVAGVGCGAIGLVYGFFKKPAASLSPEPASEFKEISNTPYHSLNG
jgi:hypothetical protein